MAQRGRAYERWELNSAFTIILGSVAERQGRSKFGVFAHVCTVSAVSAESVFGSLDILPEMILAPEHQTTNYLKNKATLHPI